MFDRILMSKYPCFKKSTHLVSECKRHWLLDDYINAQPHQFVMSVARLFDYCALLVYMHTTATPFLAQSEAEVS